MIFQQHQSSKNSNTNTRKESTNEKQKECKTLKIDLDGAETPELRSTQP